MSATQHGKNGGGEMQINAPKGRRNLRRVNQFCEENPAFTQGAIRWHLHNSWSNGLDAHDAVVRLGRCVYIDVDRFFEWLEKKQTDAA